MFNLDENDKLSILKDNDLKEFLILLQYTFLTLRDTINIGEDYTFGFEFEYENTSFFDQEDIRKNLKQELDNGWFLTTDGSISVGGELKSPILYDVTKTWKDIKKVSNVLSSNASIGKIASGHIHIGKHALKSYENLYKFMKIWITFEDVIYRFSNGEYLGSRPQINKYARPISKHFLFSSSLKNIEQDKFYQNHRQSVNFSTGYFEFDKRNTIEFRCPNGTLNPVIWQNNLNLFAKMISYAVNDYDDDLISSILSDNSIMYYVMPDKFLPHIYNRINIKKAILFSDIVFDNNLDKLYFLRQYFKNFEKGNKYVKVKTFTK